MKTLRTLAASAALVAALPCHADIALVGISEAGGGGTAAGSSFKNGYAMAIAEVNASGGVLGQQLVLTQLDIDSKPEEATAAGQKAAAVKPFAVLGPVFSGLTIAAMSQTGKDSLPHFTGGEAVSVTRKFHPSVLRTSLSQEASMPRLASFVFYGLGIKKMAALWIDNEFGRDGFAAFNKAAKTRSGTVTIDRGVKPGQREFAAVVKEIIAAKPDGLLLYLNEDEAADALKELRRQGFDKPIVGDGPIASQKVIDAAGGAAEGVYAHTGISVDAPNPQLQAFVQRYTAKYGARPDHNSVKGYFAVHVIKAGLTEVGKVDSAAFLKKIKDIRLDKRKYPELLSSVAYDFFGDLNRDSYFLTVRDGRARVLASMTFNDSGFVELPNGKQLPFNSNEFRRELVDGINAAKPSSPK